MKILLSAIFTLCFLTSNQAAEKEPFQTKNADSLKNESTSLIQRDTMKPVNVGQELIVDSADLSRLFMYFANTEQSRKVPELKMYAIHQPYEYIGYISGYRKCYLSDESAYSFSDTLIISGFEESSAGSSVFTVWKKSGDKYRFINALHVWLLSYANVDTVISLRRNRYLLAGLTECSDEGDAAGSIWFAIWELPGTFRMIFYDKWFAAYDDNRQYSYNYSFKDNNISLEKLVVNYRNDHYPSIHTYWKASRSIIDIDLSSKIDRTEDFNSYEDVGE